MCHKAGLVWATINVWAQPCVTCDMDGNDKDVAASDDVYGVLYPPL